MLCVRLENLATPIVRLESFNARIYWQILAKGFFGQLCFGGKNFRVQALDARREYLARANRPNCDLPFIK